MRHSILVLITSTALAACGGGAKSGDTTAETAAPGASAAPAAAAPVAAPPAPAMVEVTIPTGTSLRLSLGTAVASDTSTVEQAVKATLRTAVAVDGHEVLPVGTELTGVVTEAERSGRVKGRASVAVRFSTVRAHGERYDAKIAPISRVAAATKGEDAKKIAIGAGAGAALGAILGGKGGAAKGAAIGGAGGTGVVLATRGDEVRLGAGAELTTRLTAPLTVRIPK